jgi:hypothetical protein
MIARQPEPVHSSSTFSTTSGSADEGARHQHALVDVERIGAQPGLVGDVRRRHPLHRAPLDHRQHLQHFFVQQARVEEGIELVERELEGMQDQVGSFVERLGAAMPEEQLGGVETGDRIAQQVARGAEGIGVHGLVSLGAVSRFSRVRR